MTTTMWRLAWESGLAFALAATAFLCTFLIRRALGEVAEQMRQLSAVAAEFRYRAASLSSSNEEKKDVTQGAEQAPTAAMSPPADAPVTTPNQPTPVPSETPNPRPFPDLRTLFRDQLA